MDRELVIAVPGPWGDRSELMAQIVESTAGQFMVAGMVLAAPSLNDHIVLDIGDPEPAMRRAFQLAGRGKLKRPTIGAIAQHRSVAYAHFPIQVSGQQHRIRRFTEVLRQSGGFAVKIESAGIAHEWEDWAQVLGSDHSFAFYDGFVTLIADEQHYYSCGMHHFDLPDIQVPRSLADADAAHLMHQFNYYRITQAPAMEQGHTFSLSADAHRYALSRVDDTRYPIEHLFHNPQGLWDLR